eukprot:scaffold74479_cov31-Prasinocladus_malaysianus.AAC.1
MHHSAGHGRGYTWISVHHVSTSMPSHHRRSRQRYTRQCVQKPDHQARRLALANCVDCNDLAVSSNLNDVWFNMILYDPKGPNDYAYDDLTWPALP